MNKQRKLTWIEKKQIERIAFDHPFFDMHGTVLSKKEAKAIIRSAEARKSGVEIVFEACDKASVPRPDFVDNHSSVFDNLKEIVAIPAIRRIGIIAIALILLIVFFAVTPTGRAIAESVIQYIATLFDDGRLIVNQSDNETQLFFVEDSDKSVISEQDERDDLMAYVFLESFDEFVESTGKTPVILSLPILELYYVHYPEIDYLELHSRYETANGEIIAFQIWDVDDSFSTTLIGISTLDADESIYYSIEEDGTIVVIKVLDESVLYLESKGTYSVDELAKLITSDKT